jgi:hypothetical protein
VVAAKNIEIRPRIRNLRITSSFNPTGAGFPQTASEYCRVSAKTRLLNYMQASPTLPAHEVMCNYRASRRLW